MANIHFKYITFNLKHINIQFSYTNLS
ncbi:hypothetical protein Gotri_013246 [Gossypium trilobum]|uniref:Uncharacterized protein n=1 Tax=Gossypium trilobum TaxID=34281 RepID=A0A7J9DU23_9ROSI|nr:hypothetical protein [Gossypium trilobum]